MRWVHLPKQGSEAWIQSRTTSVGGSEFERMMKDLAGLVAFKAGLKNMPEMLAMLWGTMMEASLRNICAELFKTEIYESSSIPSVEVVGKTYSMDGMGVVSFLCDAWDDIPMRYRTSLITLFEFKCPYSRLIKQGQIYPAYIPQVKSGLCDLGIPEIALYVEGVFRLCRFEDLGSNSRYETILHKRDPPAFRQLLPMACGFIGFYMTRAQVFEGEEFLLDWLTSGQMDFAKSDDSYDLHRLLKLVKSGEVEMWNSGNNIYQTEFDRCPYFADQRVRIRDTKLDMDTELARFYRFVRERKCHPLGIVSYKLMDINVVPVEKEVGYTKKFEPQIHDCLAKIDQLRQIEDEGERQAAWETMFDRGPAPEETEYYREVCAKLDDYIL